MLYNLRVLQLHTQADLCAELRRIGAESSLLRDLVDKGTFRIVKLERVPLRLARFLYQELVLEGGEVVLPARLDERTTPETEMLLLGTRYQLRHLVIRIRTQSDDELRAFADELECALALYDDAPRGSLTIRGTRFDWGKRTYVMGVVNITADFVDRAEQLLANGADILEVVDVASIERVREKVAAPIAAAASNADVAHAALDAGADIVNGAPGLDTEMRRVVAQRGVPIVIAHNRKSSEYRDWMADVIRQLREQIELALNAGIAPERIIIDPGIGLGKTAEQDLELLNRLGELRVPGHPILLDVSRVGESAEETAVAIALGIEHGADIVRVHDVKRLAHVARMTDAIVRPRGQVC